MNTQDNEYWQAGFAFAADIPRYNLDMLRDGMDEDQARDAAFNAWHEAQDNARQFSPFEFTASAINKSDDPDANWEAFDAGIDAAFEHAWTTLVLRRYTFAIDDTNSAAAQGGGQ